VLGGTEQGKVEQNGMGQGRAEHQGEDGDDRQEGHQQGRAGQHSEAMVQGAARGEWCNTGVRDSAAWGKDTQMGHESSVKVRSCQQKPNCRWQLHT
jgi:hypothetical protein